jgi:hypothetical protein
MALAALFSASPAGASGKDVESRTSAADKTPATKGTSAGLTFLAWSDQHVKTDGNGKHLEAPIDAMNQLAGTAYPAAIGGKVARPAFVFGAGDITEWPTHASMRTYDALITRRLKIRAYDIAGNHDSGGRVPSATIHKWLIARHGALTYTFDKGGVRFVALHSKFDPNGKPAQPLTAESLARLRKELAKAPKDMPVVVATHLSFVSATNVGDLVKAFGDANVILWMGGHYHKAAVGKRKRFNFIQLPSPKSDFPEVTVVRITSDRLVAIPWDYVKKAWTTDRRKVLDVKIRGPKPTPAARPAPRAKAG